jgi:tight adherence protein B
VTGVAVLAALSAAAALALLAPVRPRLPQPPRSRPARGGPALLLALAPLLVALPSQWLVPAVVGAAALGVGWLLWLRRRERRTAQATGGRVLEACEHLASELASGQPPGAALARAAVDWPVLAPVAEAFRVGSDVPTALRAVAARPGADDLRLLAAAWHVAHRTGQGLADAVDRVARQLVEARATRRVVDGELASARATARLVALLPVAALLMGSGVGGDPVGFLLGTPAGWLCLAVGLAFGLAGLWWIEALARDADRGS